MTQVTQVTQKKAGSLLIFVCLLLRHESYGREVGGFCVTCVTKSEHFGLDAGQCTGRR